MTMLYEMSRETMAANEDLLTDARQEGEGRYSVLVLSRERDVAVVIEFANDDLEKARDMAAEWIATFSPLRVSARTVRELLDKQLHFSVDGPIFKVTTMQLDGELPVMPDDL